MNPELIQQRIEQVECLILKQDTTIKEQQQQNAALQNQIEAHLQIKQQQKTEYDMKIQQAEAILQQHQQQYQSQSQHNTTFGLDTNQIINQFNQIKPFGPKNNLSSFIKTVENLIALCGNNYELQKFGIKIIKNQKFFGRVADSINLLADGASWEDIKTQLIKDLRPKTSYSSQTNDEYADKILKEAAVSARKISIFNLTASFCDVTGALIYPLLCDGRIHPFGVALPGVDMTASPVYEIFYIMQFPTPLILTVMYMPFVSLFASFAMFGKSALMILQHKLEGICEDGKTEEEKYIALKECIAQYNRLVCYTNDFNSLVTYIVFIEFLLFGAIICSLLFCMNIIESFTQIISIIMYILTMMYVLFTYYWHANELLIESIKVSEAAYSIPWYYCNKRFRKTLLLFIIRAQEPLQIMVGNIYPMTLATFQSLLNTSYTYFTMLRGLYQ